MANQHHLFLALSRRGWGETILGANVARQLMDAGDAVTFVAHEKCKPALHGLNCEIVELSDATMPYIWLLLESQISSVKYSSLILSDYLSTEYTLRFFGISAEPLFKIDLPIITLDTWQQECTGDQIDLAGRQNWGVSSWIDKLDFRITPVPVAKPTARGAYCCLNPDEPIADSLREHVRNGLGVSTSEKAVLICTSEWQHNMGPHKDLERIERAVPSLMMSYIEQLPPSVRLIHIGPQSFGFQSAQYTWVPPMKPHKFSVLLHSVDLLLTPNISATTIGRSIVAGVPVLAVQNSYAAASAEQLAELSGVACSELVRQWLPRALPLYPFCMWPIGFYHFLKPLLHDNPYCDAIDLVELIDQKCFVDTCNSLLFDEAKREDVRRRQAAYLDCLRRLPTIPELVDGFLANRTAAMSRRQPATERCSA